MNTNHMPVFGFHQEMIYIECLKRMVNGLFIIDDMGDTQEVLSQHLYKQECFYTSNGTGEWDNYGCFYAIPT
jgi:hypothetical protein